MTDVMEILTRLESRRNADGGFGPVRGAISEPEPTALVGLAADDPDATAWLEAASTPDGSVGIAAGSVFRDLTSVASLVMRDPATLSGAIGWVERSRARAEPSTEELPHDPTLRGWSWTSDTFGWVEPTAWAVLALRIHGSAGPALQDGIAVLRDRETVGGGWNYGNRIVLGESLPPFVQPTGLALLALAGVDDPIVDRGAERLAILWPEERDGVLSLAVATAALRTLAHPRSYPAASDLRARLREVDVDEVDTIALAWAAIALGDGLDRLAVA
jgi:hypothetical protein